MACSSASTLRRIRPRGGSSASRAAPGGRPAASRPGAREGGHRRDERRQDRSRRRPLDRTRRVRSGWFEAAGARPRDSRAPRPSLTARRFSVTTVRDHDDEGSGRAPPARLRGRPSGDGGGSGPSPVTHADRRCSPASGSSRRRRLRAPGWAASAPALRASSAAPGEDRRLGRPQGSRRSRPARPRAARGSASAPSLGTTRGGVDGSGVERSGREAFTPTRRLRRGRRGAGSGLGRRGCPRRGSGPERDVVSSGEARARSQGWPGRPGPRGGVPPSRSSAGDPGTAEVRERTLEPSSGRPRSGAARARPPERPRSAQAPTTLAGSSAGRFGIVDPLRVRRARRPRRSRAAREERRASGARDGPSAERGVGEAPGPRRAGLSPRLGPPGGGRGGRRWRPGTTGRWRRAPPG